MYDRKHSSYSSTKMTIIYLCMVALMLISTFLPLLFYKDSAF